MESLDKGVYTMPKRVEDKDGIWELNANGVTWDLIEPSDRYLEEHEKEPEILAPEPTQEEINLDLDYRLCLVELGLQ